MNKAQIVGVVAVGALIIGVIGFGIAGGLPSFLGQQNATSSGSSSSDSTGATGTTSTPTLVIGSGTTQTTGTIKRGPTSPEPNIPLKVPVDPGISSSPANPAPTSTNDSPNTPAPQNFTIHASDESADLTNITVPKGTPVTITFFVNTQGTYYGGLDFRSSVLNTGTIKVGESKTISFNANQSFSFTPYWPASNVAKPYKITIVAQ